MTEFHIPLHPEDLQSSSSDHAFAVPSDLRFSVDLAESKKRPFHALDSDPGVIHELGFNEPLCILDPNQFQGVFIVISEFRSLVDGELKTSLLDALSSNLKLLSTTIEASANQNPEDKVELRSGVKVYVFLANWVWNKILTTPGFEPATPSVRRQRRTSSRVRKSVVFGDDVFDWRPYLEKTLLSISAVISVDLQPLWPGSKTDQRLLESLLSFAHTCLTTSGDLIRRQGVKSSLYGIFGRLAVEFGMLEQVASCLVMEAHRTEGLGPNIAEIAVQTQEQLGTDGLTGALFQELTKTSPKDWSLQWESTKGRSTSIKSISRLIECFGDQLADCMIRHSAVLEPYWSCTAHPIRNALLSITGAMIQVLDHPNGREQQFKLLDRLLQRFFDVNAFTRARCASIWIQLTQRSCVPIDYWLDLTKMAVDRLQDATSIVKKSSIALIQALVEYNPFGENLNKDRYQVTLESYRGKLQDCPVDQKDQEDHQKNLFLVQNLETAVQFIGLVEEGLEVAAGLLISSSINVVQEAIQLAVICKQVNTLFI